MNKNKFLLKLKKEKPTLKWIFIFKAILFWLFFIIFILIGIISTSLIIYSIFNNDFDIDKTTLNTQIKIILNSLPYIWIVITAGFFAVSYFNFKNTENGYKYLTIKNIIITFVGSIVLGIFFYNIGFAKFLDTKLQDSLPIYKNYMMRHMQTIWNNPKYGLLIGKIINIESDKKIILKDYNNKEWNILITENTNMKGGSIISINNGIKIIGIQIDNSTFEAQEIRPETGRMMQGGKNER